MFVTFKDSNMFILYMSYILDFFLYVGFAFMIESYKKSGITFFEFITQCFRRSKVGQNQGQMSEKDISSSLLPGGLEQNATHELVIDEELIAQHNRGETLQITNLVKHYGDLLVVNDFNSEFYKNQIFCLLGHNGAGKTTTIKIISGMEDAENGRIVMDGRNLITEKSYLFQNIGLCSQDDIIFDQLTVQEHLVIMSEIKGTSNNMDEINDLLTKIDLADKRDAEASTLSGGQKRKLCISMALIGNSKIILLDEPTSGMDVTAKRQLWHFLKNYKENKVIILTTHSLDEAEFLGDRIGIMNEGKLACTGTSSYLKNIYSCGFSINFVVDHTRTNKSLKTQFVRELKKVEPGATVKVMSKEIIVINFPEITNTLDAIFDCIESQKDKYFIINYTLATTSLEDVFLKLNSNNFSRNLFEQKNNDVDMIAVNSGENSINNVMDQDLTSSKQIGFFHELWLGLARLLKSLWRNKKGFVLEIIACSVTFFVYMLFFQSLMNNSDKTISLVNLLKKTTIYYSKGINASFDPQTYFTPYPDLILESMDGDNISTGKGYEQFIFDKFPAHNVKTAFFVEKNDDKTLDVSTLYSPTAVDFFYAINSVFISSFLKQEYGIDTQFIVKYS